MAYIAKILKTDIEWRGPFPNKAGEFCGNVHKDSLRVSQDGIVIEIKSGDIELNNAWHSVSNFRAGRPSSTLAKTSEEMEKEGYLGLYLISDLIGFSNRFNKEVETDILLEDVVTGQRKPLYPFNPQVSMKSK